MSSLNKVVLIGRLGKEPEVRVMQNSKEVASFSVATSEVWKDKNSGEKVEKTEWHNVVVFNEGLIKTVQQFLHKGSRVYIEGSLKTRKWTDASGNERYTTEVVLSNFNSMLIILDNKSSINDESAGSFTTKDEEKYNSLHQSFRKFNTEDIDDEIPF